MARADAVAETASARTSLKPGWGRNLETYLKFIVLGIASGSIYAALAIGLVLTYRADRVVNFAYGAMAMYIAYVYAGLTNDGHYPIPPLPNPLALVAGISERFFNHPLSVPSWPTFIDFGSPVGKPLAVALALLTSIGLGLLVHYVIFRPLRHSPMLTKLVASVALLLVLQNVIVLRFGNSAVNVTDILSTRPVHVFGSAVPLNRFLLLFIIIAITILLKLVYSFTRFGLATRAAAENEKGATLVGLNADGLAAVNWVLASLLAGFVGILVAPITSLDPSNYTAFIIPALAAALVAGFSSYTVAAAVGLGIGALESITLQLQVDFPWLPRIGLRESIAFIVIVVAMVASGRSFPARGEVGVGRQSPVPEPRHLLRNAAIVCLIGIPLAVYLPPVWRGAAINTSIGVVMALSLVVIVGYVGQISLAQLAFAGIAAFMLGEFATHQGVPFPLAPLLAALGALIVGVVAGLPALKVRGVNLAVLTLGLAFAVDNMIFRNSKYSGGSAGLVVASPSLFGLKLGPNDRFFLGDNKSPSPAFLLFVLFVAVVVAVAVGNLRRGSMGRRMVAVRTNERAAASIGTSVTRTKLTAFGVAAFVAGIAGCLSTYKVQAVSGPPFATLGALAVLAIALLGGITSIRGAVIAGLLAEQGIMARTTQSVFHSGKWFSLVTALGLLITVLANPEGISGGLDRMQRQFLRLIGRPSVAQSAPLGPEKSDALPAMPDDSSGTQVAEMAE